MSSPSFVFIPSLPPPEENVEEEAAWQHDMAAQQFYRVKLWARAKASLEKAIENVPSHARHSNLSGAMLNMDEIQLALANANTAIAMTDMGYAPGYERKGRALFALSQTAEEPLRSESAFEAIEAFAAALLVKQPSERLRVATAAMESEAGEAYTKSTATPGWDQMDANQRRVTVEAALQGMRAEDTSSNIPGRTEHAELSDDNEPEWLQEMGLVLEAVTRDVPQSTVSRPPAGQPIEPSGTKQTLKEMVDAIKQELELGGSMASVIRQANELMGLAPYSLTLPEQAEQLMSRLGV